jgi:hypothetical protein
MSAKTGSAHSRYAGLLPIEPPEDFLRPIDLKPEDVPFPKRRPSARKRPRARLLIAFCTGAAATLLWQWYGDAARGMITNLYPQLSWLAPPPALTAQNRHPPDLIAPAGASAEQLNAMSIDRDVVGQRVDERATAVAGDQEPTTRSTDQTTATKATGTPEGRADEASVQPKERFDRKPTEARPPQTLSERGKQLSAASRHDASCFPSASAVLRNHPGGWASWTLRAPGHEGTMCWYDAARPPVSDHRPRVSDYRSEMMRSEEIVGTGDTELFVPLALRGWPGLRAGWLP